MTAKVIYDRGYEPSDEQNLFITAVAKHFSDKFALHIEDNLYEDGTLSFIATARVSIKISTDLIQDTENLQNLSDYIAKDMLNNVAALIETATSEPI